MEEALFLTRFATKVYRPPPPRELPRLARSCWSAPSAHPKIETAAPTPWSKKCWASKRTKCAGLRMRNVKTNEESVLPVTGLFLGIGHKPNAKMFHGQIDLDDDGYIAHKDNVFTRRNGMGSGRLCLRRRAGPALPPGDHRRRHRLHGRARSREVPRRTRPLSSAALTARFASQFTDADAEFEAMLVPALAVQQ